MGIRINDDGVKYFRRFYLILINLILEFLIELPKVFFYGLYEPPQKAQKKPISKPSTEPKSLDSQTARMAYPTSY